MQRQFRHVAPFRRAVLILFVALASLAPSQSLSAHPHSPAAPVAYGKAYHQRPRSTYYGFPHKYYGWGWYGNRYRGQVHSHRGYYGDVWEWGHRLRY